MPAPKFVDKVVSQRMERMETYRSSKSDMDKWQQTVSSNRHAAVLDLSQDSRRSTSFKSLVSKYSPLTDMEREIEMVLVKHHATDQAAQQMVIRKGLTLIIIVKIIYIFPLMLSYGQI